MKSSTNKSLTSFAVIILSLIGLLAGLHVHTGHEAAMHVGHFEEFTVLDPCYGYAASLLISTYIFVREAFKRLIQKDEA